MAECDVGMSWKDTGMSVSVCHAPIANGLILIVVPAFQAAVTDGRDQDGAPGRRLR